MTKAAELAKMGEVLTNSQIGGRRNIVINGAMQVAQRGTTGTLNNGGSDFHSADRFFSSEEGSFTGAFTVSNDTDSPAGFSNSTKWDCTTADTTLGAGDSFFVDHKIEAQNLQQLSYGTSDALKMTLSFFIKSNKTGTYVAWLYNYDANRQVSVLYTISVANTWEHKTLTFPADTTGSFNNDNGVGMVIRFIMGSGTTYTSGTAPSAWQSLVDANRYVGQTVNLADSTDNSMNITGVQLEVGSQATPFEHRSFGEEKLLCGRYYQKKGGEQVHSVLGHGYNHTTDDAIIFVPLTPEMRAVPTLDTGTLSKIRVTDQDASTEAIGALTIGGTDSRTGMASLNAANITGDTQTAGEATALVCNNDADGYVAFIAEL